MICSQIHFLVTVTWFRIINGSCVFQRHGANGSVESAAHERALRGFNSGESRRGEAVERRAKTHFRREDPIAWFGLAQRLAWGRGEHMLRRRAQEGNVEHRL